MGRETLTRNYSGFGAEFERLYLIPVKDRTPGGFSSLAATIGPVSICVGRRPPPEGVDCVGGE